MERGRHEEENNQKTRTEEEYCSCRKTEQTSLPTCAQETFLEPIAPTDETLCEETLQAAETRNEQTLPEPIAPT